MRHLFDGGLGTYINESGEGWCHQCQRWVTQGERLEEFLNGDACPGPVPEPCHAKGVYK